VLQRLDFIDAAARAGRFVLDELRAPGGRLLRSWRDGRTSGPAFLDDYAMLADGLLTLYETTFDVSWWSAAVSLSREMMTLFADPAGGFFDTGSDVSQGIVRPKDLFDNATPSGNSSASEVLLRLAALSGVSTFEEAAMGFLRLIAPALTHSPGGFGNALSALDRALGRSVEIAVVGDLHDEGMRALLDTAWEPYLPNRVIAAGVEGTTEPPLLEDRPPVNGGATAFVCENFACKMPVTEAAELANLLLP